MQFSILALCLAVAAPLASAAATPLVGPFPLKVNGLHCRSSPSTSGKVVKTYSSKDKVSLSCQTPGEVIEGDTLWDKTGDNCYVADYYVKTGTDSMVAKACPGSTGGSSTVGGKISRKEIISRGQYWIDRHVPYSMYKEYPDPEGTEYRTDCSGFVSMALHASHPGYSTVSLPEIAKAISWNDLQPGDFVGTLGAGTGGADGHVTLFKSWVNSSKKSYHSLECRGTAYGCVEYTREINWKDGSHTAKPYRYIHVSD